MSKSSLFRSFAVLLSYYVFLAGTQCWAETHQECIDRCSSEHSIDITSAVQTYNNRLQLAATQQQTDYDSCTDAHNIASLGMAAFYASCAGICFWFAAAPPAVASCLAGCTAGAISMEAAAAWAHYSCNSTADSTYTNSVSFAVAEYVNQVATADARRDLCIEGCQPDV